MASKTSTEENLDYPEVYERLLGQIEQKMEFQFKKLNDRIDALKRDMDLRFRNIARHFEATEARIEELNVQLNMLSVMQSTS
jgi:hypothetical protein